MQCKPFDPNKPTRLIWLALGSVAVAEFASHARADAIVIDLQHGLWERGSLEAAVGIVGARLPVIVRCAENTNFAIAQALDAGASSVLVPLVETADDARRAVAASHYPPKGLRSAGGVRPLMHGLQAMTDTGSRIKVGVLIETAAGIDNLAGILDVPGIDYAFIGTGDLSLCRGAGHAAQVEDDVRRVHALSGARGIPCGIFTATAQDAEDHLARGYGLVVSANDIAAIQAGFSFQPPELSHRPS